MGLAGYFLGRLAPLFSFWPARMAVAVPNVLETSAYAIRVETC